MWTKLILLLVVSSFAISSASISQPSAGATAAEMFSTLNISLSMKEETPVNTILDNLFMRFPRDFLLGPRKNVRFLNDDRRVLEVMESGDVRVNSLVDLETACATQQLCCSMVEVCVISVNVYVRSGSMKLVHLELHVTDTNDMRPQFPRGSEAQVVQVSESASLGSTWSLVSATDGDATKVNRIKEYSLVEESHTFLLVQSPISNNIELKLMSPLDYERRKNYTATLRACDPTFCTAQGLQILVLDENDNRPVFDIQNQVVNVSENMPPFREIVKLHCTDADSGENARIIYFFDASANSPDIFQTFMLNATSGSVSLSSKPLSATLRNRYRLVVGAKDHGVPKSLEAERPAEVVVNVADVNDHAPEISVVAADDGKLSVVENKEPPINVADIRVKDRDIGENARFACHLEEGNESFILSEAMGGMFTLETTRVMDQEEESELKVKVVCRDFGTPSQESTKLLIVTVLDVNEYAPTFQLPLYKASVLENSPPGVPVLQLQASDRDKGTELRYQLDELGLRYFSVDPTSGRIETGTQALDREEVEQFTFTAFVLDAEIEPKKASTIIQISVLDQNDNAPMWQILPKYKIKENLPRFTPLGQPILATDADLGENGQIRYSIAATWTGPTIEHGSLTRLSNNYFRVDPDTGEMQTVVEVDRELTPFFLVEVEAADRGRVMLSTLANITIQILDMNDNAPQFRQPLEILRAPSRKALFNVSQSKVSMVGAPILTVLAVDADEGENGRVSYHLERLYEKFVLNHSTGQLSVKSPLDAGVYELYITASDQGFPQQSNRSLLLLNVFGNSNAHINFVVIVAMISMTTLVSLVLLLAILCIRRKPNSSSSSQFNAGPGNKNKCPNQAVNPSQTRWSFPAANGMDSLSRKGHTTHTSTPYYQAPDAMDSTAVQNFMDSQLYHIVPGMTAVSSSNTGIPLVGVGGGRSAVAMLGLADQLDHESGDSGRGGSENDEASQLAWMHHQMALMDAAASRNMGVRGLGGSLQRPCAPTPQQQAGSYRMQMLRMTPTRPVNPCHPSESQAFLTSPYYDESLATLTGATSTHPTSTYLPPQDTFVLPSEVEMVGEVSENPHSYLSAHPSSTCPS